MIFITGGTGLLGVRLVYDLLKKGERLRVLSRETSDMVLFEEVLKFYGIDEVDGWKERLQWVEGDVLDIDLIEASLSDCDYCIHAAAMVSFHSADAQKMHEINVQGTANVVNACLQYPGMHLLHISSVAALGRSGKKQRIDEDEIWKDSPYNTEYALSKYLSEMEVWRGMEEGLAAVIVNPSIILGAGSSSRSSGTIFGAVLSGLKFYTEGSAAVVDVRDVSRCALELLFENVSAERFVLSAEEVPFKTLFKQVAMSTNRPIPTIHAKPWLLQLAWRAAWIKDKITGSRSPITSETARSSVSSFSYDNGKIKRRLNTTLTPAEESISFFAPFYLAGDS